MKIFAVALFSFFAFYACDTGSPSSTSSPVQAASTPTPADTSAGGKKHPDLLGTPERVASEPTNVMEFFAALPDKYFTLEGCDRATDKNCEKARGEYLKQYSEVADIKNGYFKGGCDGGQSCIEMAIFKRPNGKYLIGVSTTGEMINDFYFLDYADGQWRDASSEVPEYGPRNWYEFPRVGTTVSVFEKKIVEKGDDYEATEKGRKLYDLVWKDGKFTRK
jgi:hypothetical protein